MPFIILQVHDIIMETIQLCASGGMKCF